MSSSHLILLPDWEVVVGMITDEYSTESDKEFLFSLLVEGFAYSKKYGEEGSFFSSYPVFRISDNFKKELDKKFGKSNNKRYDTFLLQSTQVDTSYLANTSESSLRELAVKLTYFELSSKPIVITHKTDYIDYFTRKKIKTITIKEAVDLLKKS